MKLNYLLIGGFLVVALLVGAVGYLSIAASQGAMEKSIGGNSVTLAVELMEKIDRNIQSRIEAFQGYATDATLQKHIIESNQEFEKLGNIREYIDEKDKAWSSQPKETITPFMQELIGNDLSDEIIELTGFYKNKYGRDVYAEVFVTNKYGANAAQTGKTSDYYQADEEWWQNAKKDGLYVEDVEYDESADVTSIAIGIRIDDENGSFIGIIKAILNIDEVISIVKEFEPSGIHEGHRTMHFKLITKDGRIIYSTKEYTLLEKIPDESYTRLFGHTDADGNGEKHTEYFVFKEEYGSGKEDELVSHAVSRGYKDFKGLGWNLIVEHETGEAFSPIIQLRNTLLIISAIAIVLAVLAGLFISRIISKPIKKFSDAVDDILKGNFGVQLQESNIDEVKSLNKIMKTMKLAVMEKGPVKILKESPKLTAEKALKKDFKKKRTL